ncbi:MAG: phosphoribosylamine--glycine ligase [Leptolyngbyaceae cyanobacterium SM1_1_3]|nr:phosphoribosylamine--glycine ligase [Leptolyngbyaceae cyanobacterium SM1_1_3]NJN03190.1 phosphoribosylamine--glycine ligase [Leptolyngbyaceae cyanobacterium RM1_1_2]NJO08891.1 phosphoribosylamine--glycine ligase [Leptolyngbyaceae cyanobacterium SL_1_1]
MKALIIGSGGREHALAWKLLQSPRIAEVVCIPGNGGTAALAGCRNLPLSISDFEGITRFSLVNNMAFVVVGSEQPLAAGITDYLQAQDIKVFGPTKIGAQIESSKSWAKTLMQAAGIPTPDSKSFTEAAAAIAYIEQQGTPIVIKADGLASGKGVTVAHTLADARAAVNKSFSGHFGLAGERILVESYLQGQEVSVLAVTDGLTIRPLIPAQDHKTIGEGDTGANTGGMGAYAPTPVVDQPLLGRIQTEILEPALKGLQQQNIDYRGVLYAGLMVTPQEDLQVIEFNCRFGDPETQAILPLLETPLDAIILACLEQRLADFPPFEWKSAAAACVVMAAAGYPDVYPKGMVISGLEAAAETDAIVFHAGTRRVQQQVQASGGRVLGVTAVGETFESAIANAYRAVECIEFEHSYYRSDVGYRVKVLPGT